MISKEVLPQQYKFSGKKIDVFFDADLEEFFLGTSAPFSLASESPIAIACLGFVTFLLLFPLLSFPSCISCIALSTFPSATLEYFAILLNFKISK
jgi:hypothetical protein